MPKVWKTLGLCDCACKRFNVFAATASRREADCYLHRMFPEEKIVNLIKLLLMKGSKTIAHAYAKQNIKMGEKGGY